MPIRNLSHSKNIINRLTRQTKLLVKNNSIPLPDLEDDKIFITSIFEIQQIQNYNEPEIKTSSPEGYRILLRYKSDILVAVDFYYHGKRLYFSYSFHGYLLGQLIDGLNAIEEMYRIKKGNYQLCFVNFLHAQQPYFILFTEKKLFIYTYHEKLNKISKKQLKSKLSKLQSNIKPITLK